MAAVCPNCKAALQMEQIPLRKDVEMICASCQTWLIISLVVRTSASEEPAALAGGALNPKRVLTAVEGEASNEMIREVLSAEGFEIVTAGAFDEIIQRIEKERPGVILVDVGLPQVEGFHIASVVKKKDGLKDLGVILLASIHDATKYKREPDSLYGADDYIERHHIQDQLVPKIRRLLQKAHPGSPAGTSVPGRPQTKEEAPRPVEPEKIKEIEEAMTIEHVFETMMEEERAAAAEKTAAEALKKGDEPVSKKGDPAAHEAAKRLARLIISDIALYNQKAVEEGVKKGSFRQVLQNEIDEGKKLYNERIPDEIVSSTNYYNEAIDDFIRKRRAQMEQGG